MKFQLLVLMFLTSCSGLLPHRTFLEEMEYEDESFLEAGVDFPILDGDTGRTWRSKSEWRHRIPASKMEIEKRATAGMLSDELEELENSLSDEENDFYQTYKHKFPTQTEKIYFLQLGSMEKRYYLQSKGLLEYQTNYASVASDSNSTETLAQGMSKKEVKNILGTPTKVEVDGNPWFQNEKWLYEAPEKTHFVYFQAGRVEYWK